MSSTVHRPPPDPQRPLGQTPNPQPPTPNPYPLLVRPEFHARVWGGRRLAAVLGAELPEGAIGESWSMGAANRVLNGPLAGQTIGALAAAAPEALLGSLALREGRRDLPLLFKILDANEPLSIQVHPDDNYAHAVEHMPYGKTEAWYVLDAAPGAFVVHGFTRPVAADEVRAALADGTITALVRRVEVQAGDTLLVPAGTIHAIGGGLLLGEIQENSDITYRLYDWGRPREMQVDQALAVLDLAPPGFAKSRPLDVAHGAGTIRHLVACRYFAYQDLRVAGRLPLETGGRSLHILFCYEGTASVRYAGGDVPLGRGQTCCIPAALGSYTVEGRGCRLLRSLVPDLQADVIDPLVGAGYGRAAIAALGGAPGNELDALLAPGGNG